MTGEQFGALARLLRLRPGPASAAARLVLVDGLRPAQAADRTGCSPQSVSNTLAACRRGIDLARRAAGIQTLEQYALRKESPEIGFLKDDAQRAGEGEQQ